MVFVNESTKEMFCKLVYYGPGLSGKTTNLEKIHENPQVPHKGKMVSMATETDRTLFFDFMPMDLGSIRGYKVKIQIYTVPGQVFYDATRRLVLKGADAVVFVADSQKLLLDANVESMRNLYDNLRINRLDPEKIPLVIQYNKRDLPDILDIETLEGYLNPRKVPSVEAVALKGQGVMKTLKLILKDMLYNVAKGVDISLKMETPKAVSPQPAPPPEKPQQEDAVRALLTTLYQNNENTLKLLEALQDDLREQQNLLQRFLEEVTS